MSIFLILAVSLYLLQHLSHMSHGSQVPMRYPGEWKFAGGVVDADETPLQAAMRELEEEFQVPTALTEAGWIFRRILVGAYRILRDSHGIPMGFLRILWGLMGFFWVERTRWNTHWKGYVIISTLFATLGCLFAIYRPTHVWPTLHLGCILWWIWKKAF